ncbi:MAG TPA: polyphenol oxidase family protein [Acidimicrobiales bacterium]|nr:polyphenol oxidase family protein [Acidimicrobiales bacterium]
MPEPRGAASVPTSESGAVDAAYPMDDGRRAHVRFTGVAEGDLSVRLPAAVVDAARARVLDRPWTWLHQVHGAEVVHVEYPGDRAGAAADAAVTTDSGAALAIHTADCAPVALVSPEGVVGAVHAGWRGIEAGVIEATVERMRALGAGELQAVIGPCIRSECYEFGADDLALVAARYGPLVRAETSQGRAALDVPAAVRAALGAAGVATVAEVPVCTSCDTRFFSHRARQDTGRQALLVWLE